MLDDLWENPGYFKAWDYVGNDHAWHPSFINSCENWYLVTTIPGLPVRKSWHTCFQDTFKELKHPLWEVWVVLGGNTKRITCGLQQAELCQSNSKMNDHLT